MGSCYLPLRVGAHSCVDRICQPCERTASRSWLPIVEVPGYLTHPTSTVVKYYYNLTENRSDFGTFCAETFTGHLIAVLGLFTVEAVEYIIATDTMEPAPCHLFSVSLRFVISFSNFSRTQRNPQRKERLLHYVFGYAR